MRYRIAYDQPGRLRVRFGPDAFTQEQGYGIAALLLGRPGVREAVTCALNGSVLVCYEGEGRAEALAVLRGLRRDALPVGTAADDDQLRQVDSQFLGRLLSMAARHFLKKWFLPFPVRCAVTLWNAAGYWREGLRSLGGGGWTWPCWMRPPSPEPSPGGSGPPPARSCSCWACPPCWRTTPASAPRPP